MIKSLKKKKTSPKRKLTKKEEFEKYLEKIEDPKNNQEVNYDLPENPTLLQVAKFNICQNILAYQQDNDLTDEELADRINSDLSLPEVEEILFCQIEKFTLDRLVAYANNLFPFHLAIHEEPIKSKKNGSASRFRSKTAIHLKKHT